jgi:DNA-binding response OmpR family regulator
VKVPPIYLTDMATNNTLLCIHREPAQLSLLQEDGYELVTATNGSDGLRLFMSRPVDAIVLEYQLGLLDGSVIATEIKQVKPQVPIVMLAEDMDLPSDALKSVDALVTKSDGAQFLLATLHFVLSVKPVQRQQEKLRAQTPVHLRRPGRSREGADRSSANLPQLVINEKDAPFSPRLWRSIRNGIIQF